MEFTDWVKKVTDGNIQKELDDTSRDASQLIANDVPVVTGELRDSWLNPIEYKTKNSVRIQSSCPYAGEVEFRTQYISKNLFLLSKILEENMKKRLD